MNTHDTFLDLAAIAIDFPLTADERDCLEQHLAVCRSCARTATLLRQDAAAIGHLQPVVLPERRGAEIIAAAQHPAPVRVTGRTLAIAVVLGLLLMGTLAVGAGLVQLLQPDNLSEVAPVPSLDVPPVASPAVSPPASPLASPGIAEAAAWDGNLIVARAADGSEWIELLAPDGSTVRAGRPAEVRRVRGGGHRR
jgi:hypothetical protein